MNDKSPPPKKVRAAGILLFRTTKGQRKFLLLRHPDRWDLPKGHCEKGETFREAAVRETEEETGIAPECITLDPDFSFDLKYGVTYRRWRDRVFEKQVRYFIGETHDAPTLKLTEHESAKWFDWNPPHEIQMQTIDPLLAAAAEHFSRNRSAGT